MKRPDQCHHRGFSRSLPPCLCWPAACWLATFWLATFGVATFGLATFWMAMPAAAQTGAIGNFGTLGGVEPAGQFPPPQYYIGLQIYRSGDLPSAVVAFEGSLRNSRRTVDHRMVDAIPSLAMLAECHYYLGDLESAQRYIDEAWQVATVSRRWLEKADWRQAEVTGQSQVRANRQFLWPAAASIRVAAVPDRIQVTSGELVTAQTLLRGGAVEELHSVFIDVAEIMRGLAIASYRRRILLGPLSEGDLAGEQLSGNLRLPVGIQNLPVSNSMISALGATVSFARRIDREVESLAGLAISPVGVHPVTAIAMLSHASALTELPDGKPAIAIAAGVANTAAALDQPELVGEALQIAAGCADETTAAEVARIAGSTAAAYRNQSRLAHLHCSIVAADAATTAGDLESARQWMNEAKAIATNRNVNQPRLNAYAAYVLARIAAGSGASVGNPQSSDLASSLAEIQQFALNHRNRKRSLVSMPRLFQFRIVAGALGQSLGPRSGDAWLAGYIDEPTLDVWRRDPVDAIAGVIADKSAAQVARLRIAAAGTNPEVFLQQLDRALVDRFNGQLPMGGRVARARILAIADDDRYGPDAVEVRKAAGPALKQLRAAAAANLDEPNAIAAEQMAAATTWLALSRVWLPERTLPMLADPSPLGRMPSSTAMVTFTFLGNQLIGTFSADGRAVAWNVTGGNRVGGEIVRLLSSIGVGRTRGARLPEDDDWKTSALELRDKLFPQFDTLGAGRFTDIVIVPDGVLWYLPFELLPSAAVDSPMLGDVTSIRYAPTPGLALNPAAMPTDETATAIVTDQFFAPRDIELNASIVATMVGRVADANPMPESFDGLPTGLIGGRAGDLVVAAARAANVESPLAVNIGGYDAATNYGSINSYLRTPIAIPRRVVLFGYRTPIEVGRVGNGNELFQVLCGLHAAGARDVLLSRWAVGGESSAMLLGEFLQELPAAGMTDAWTRSKKIFRDQPIDPTTEPLITKGEQDREGLTGNEPLFYSGYLTSTPAPEAAQTP